MYSVAYYSNGRLKQGGYVKEGYKNKDSTLLPSFNNGRNYLKTESCLTRPSYDRQSIMDKTERILSSSSDDDENTGNDSWGFTDCLVIELDMSYHTMYFFTRGIRQPIVIRNTPKYITVGV